MAGESSPLLDRRTTKTRSVIFGALRSVGHAKVAEAFGISESTFSEWLQKNGDRVAILLTTLEHKPVPVANICYPPEYVKKLRYFAELGIKQEPETLDWSEADE